MAAWHPGNNDQVGPHTPWLMHRLPSRRPASRSAQAVQHKVKQGRAELLVASHNQDSIELAVTGMASLDLPADTSPIYFGQLLGMADHLTYTLGMHGYKAYKYVPYGRVEEVGRVGEGGGEEAVREGGGGGAGRGGRRGRGGGGGRGGGETTVGRGTGGTGEWGEGGRKGGLRKWCVCGGGAW